MGYGSHFRNEGIEAGKFKWLELSSPYNCTLFSNGLDALSWSRGSRHVPPSLRQAVSSRREVLHQLRLNPCPGFAVSENRQGWVTRSVLFTHVYLACSTVPGMQ